MKKILLIATLLLALLCAADYNSYAGSFLRMGLSARSLAMGGGFTAEFDRGFSAYHNPASVAFLQKRMAAFTYHNLPLGRRFIATSVASDLPPTAGLGVAWVSAGVDGIDGRTTAGEHTATLSTVENAIYISFAQRFKKWFSLGINVKILFNQLPVYDEDLTGRGIGFDAGILIRPGSHLAFGLVMQDPYTYYQWNTSAVFEEEGRLYRDVFPRIIRTGMTYQLRNLYLTGDLGLIMGEYSDGSIEYLGRSLRGGVEYTYRNNYFFRGGYGNGKFGVGGGINFLFLQENDAYLDYAMIIESLVGTTHIISYAFVF